MEEKRKRTMLLGDFNPDNPKMTAMTLKSDEYNDLDFEKGTKPTFGLFYALIGSITLSSQKKGDSNSPFAFKEEEGLPENFGFEDFEEPTSFRNKKKRVEGIWGEADQEEGFSFNLPLSGSDHLNVENTSEKQMAGSPGMLRLDFSML
jgi:hypothetical protein